MQVHASGLGCIISHTSGPASMICVALRTAGCRSALGHAALRSVPALQAQHYVILGARGAKSEG